MLSRNQQIIREYFENIYKDLLAKPCILTSITIPEKPTRDVVKLIGTFNPEVKRNNITSMPVIAINFLTENTVCELYEELKEVYLKEVKNIVTKLIDNCSIFYSLSLDYRLIEPELLKVLKKKYNESKFTLRIIGENYILNPDVYEKVSFIDEIIVNSISEHVVGIKGSDIITNNYLVIDNIIPNKGYDPINEFYITKDLSEEEFSLVVDKINNTLSSTKKLFIRTYNPEKYEYIVDNLLRFDLEEEVEINFLSNPLEDCTEHFECMKKCPHKVTITYTTDKDRIISLTKEPYSDCAHFIEELECNGKIGATDYLNILYSLDFLYKKANILELSPLEKLIYVYRYIEKNSPYFKKNEMNRERTYANKNSYAKLFSIFLRKLEVPCFVYTTNTRLKNISRIQDKKYKIDRILVTDITGDIETKRFELYKIYSFSYFGLSPIDTLKSKVADYITVPAMLVLSSASYTEYSDLSYNTLVKNNNLTNNSYDFAIKFLNMIGFNDIHKDCLKEDYYAYIANLLSENMMEPIEETILSAAITKIVEKEINDSRKEQKKFEIENTIASNRIGRGEYKNKPHILLNQNISRKKNVEVTLVEAKNQNTEFNNQKVLFTNEADYLIQEIFKIKKESISCFENNTHIIEAMHNNIIELYNNKILYPLIVMSNRKRIIRTLYNKYERKFFKDIPEDLYNYLNDYIIPEIALIKNSREIKYLLNAKESDYNTEEFSRNLLRVENKIKYFVDKLLTSKSQHLGLNYEYSDYNLTIKVDNENINDYSIQIASADIVAISKIKVKNKIYLSQVKKLDTSKKQDYIDVYLDKMRKYNEYIEEANDIISTIESIKFNVKDNNIIFKFIELEKNLIKIEENIFKQKIELSNFRNTFYNKYETNITADAKVKSTVLKKYVFNRKTNTYIDWYNKTEQEILNIANNIDINNSSIEQLIAFNDYICSYVNRMIINENYCPEDLSIEINNLYQRKVSLLQELERIEKTAKGLNIILFNRNLNSNTLIRLAVPEVIIINLDKIIYHKLKSSLKLKMNKQALNRLKSSKSKLTPQKDKLI